MATKTTAAEKEMAVGYCRVSTTTQDNERQRLLIHEYCNRHDYKLTNVIEFTASSSRKQKERGIDDLRNWILTPGTGRTVVVAEMSRLGRSVYEILRIVEELVQDRGCRLVFVKENLVLDSAVPLGISGEILLMVFALLAQVERYLIRERTRDALAALKATGMRLGRPPGKSKLDAKDLQIREWIDLGVTQRAIAKKLSCSENTLSRWIGRRVKEWAKENGKAIATGKR